MFSESIANLVTRTMYNYDQLFQYKKVFPVGYNRPCGHSFKAIDSSEDSYRRAVLDRQARFRDEKPTVTDVDYADRLCNYWNSNSRVKNIGKIYQGYNKRINKLCRKISDSHERAPAFPEEDWYMPDGADFDFKEPVTKKIMDKHHDYVYRHSEPIRTDNKELFYGKNYDVVRYSRPYDYNTQIEQEYYQPMIDYLDERAMTKSPPPGPETFEERCASRCSLGTPTPPRSPTPSNLLTNTTVWNFYSTKNIWNVAK